MPTGKNYYNGVESVIQVKSTVSFLGRNFDGDPLLVTKMGKNFAVKANLYGKKAFPESITN